VCVFCTKFWRQNVSNPKHSFVIFGAKILCEKRAHKMLMKLTPVLLLQNGNKYFTGADTFISNRKDMYIKNLLCFLQLKIDQKTKKIVQNIKRN